MQTNGPFAGMWCKVFVMGALSPACTSTGLVPGDGTAAAGGGAGASTGGASSGGAGSGGASSGGASSGGASSGGTSAGGASTGGNSSGGGGSSTGGGGSGSDFFGESRCTEGDFLLCDGFEGAAIDTTLWTVQKSSQNVVELATDQAARGVQSVHIHADDGYGYLRNTSIFPVPNGDYFGRMFLRVARFSTVDWAHWTVGEGAGTGDGSLIRVGGQYRTDAGVNRWGVGSDGGPTGDWTIHDTDPDGNPSEPPTGSWVCIEWEHKASTSETHFYVDDILHPSLSTTLTDHGGSSADYVLPNMTSFWFGWYQYQADDEAFDVWIDEVVLDDQRIGCTK